MNSSNTAAYWCSGSWSNTQSTCFRMCLCLHNVISHNKCGKYSRFIKFLI